MDTGADYDALENLPAATGREIVAALAKAVSSSEGIEVLSPAAAFGLYEGNLLGIMRDQSVVKLRAGRIVVATGAYEVPLVFDRNDLPGVMLSTAIQRLIHLHGIKPASTAMVATTNDHGYHAALDMLRAGVRVAVLVDSRSGFPHGLDAAADLQSSGVLILTSHAIVRAEGVKKVVGCVVARIEEGKLTTEERQFDGDLIAMSGGFQPAGALLQQAGCALEYDRALDQSVPTVLPPAMYAAGEVTGTGGPRVSVLEGRIAGLEAAHSLDATPDGDGMEIAALRAELDIVNSSGRSGVLATPAPSEPGVGSKKFVCFCEDVTAKDIVRAVDEGFEDIQILKRYSTVTMGPCQGKMCHKSYVDIAAERTGLGIDALGATTSRPPIQPVSLGALAGPSHMPIKRTPLDRKHRDLGAVMIDSGPWQRPQSYYSPQDECLAVRERVGIIDVSTLGKLDVQGDDAPALLDKIYTHHFSTLRPGRIRYGLLCADDGVIMDDGTVTRIADDHYFVTTSTASIEEIEQWFKWWMAGTRMCAHVTNVTNALAAVNVAGPKARDTLVKLTDVDLSPRGFRYMRSKAGDVAGVPTRFLRIGFVGETGWELHFPSEYAEYMWDTLMDAGQEFGISPFGTEAQRILRLEKKHIIAQQDTDIVSNPLDSDMEWVVRFDKEDFIGRGGLVQARERGARNKLVGFVMREDPVPADGDPVVIGPAPIGHVTSSRLSPTRGRGIGLAWVPVGLAEDGGEIWIRVDGRVVPAVVTGEPFYDPEGKRLRQ